ncbi:MAG: NAD-dependent epimerase/dehydratase family protein [Planctomycetes bacterium]|nr:NAD-dependent epimerase/dehydratase family protein [Planctomycetota bacterium]
MPPVLITGGAGFIGSHLAERLHADGARVTVLDDLSTGREANLAALRGHDGFRFVRGDASDAALLAALMPRGALVFHLAAPVGLHRVLEAPDRVLAEGVATMAAVLDAAARAGARVVLASSSEVYGKPERVPFREDDDLRPGPPSRGRWAYALMKAAKEAMALARHRRGEIEAVVIRFFNVVGPRQTGRYGMVVPRFIARAQRGLPLLVHGDGQQTRTFLHVLDAVEAVVRLAAHPNAAGEIFNVGGEEEISIRTLAGRVIAANSSSSPIHFLPYADAYPAGYEDVLRRVPDIGKVKRLTGWRPRRPLPLSTAELTVPAAHGGAES